MELLFGWLEHGALSTWIREDPFAFPALVVMHTIGMGVVVGTAAAIDLRLLGVAPGVPVAAMTRFLPFGWGGFVLNAASGVGLLIAYPTKALTNPVFYLKLTCIFLAAWTLRVIGRGLDGPEPQTRLRRLAMASLALWATGIGAGRLLAYTYRYLLIGFPNHNI